MCGRYTLKTPASELAQVFDLDEVEALPPRWNLTPSQDGLVVLDEAPRRAQLLRWGLLPSWLRAPPKINPPVNARSESVASKPFFRHAFHKQRALVLLDGYYEWHLASGVDGATIKVPHYICRPDGGPFAVAGLWEQAQAARALRGASPDDDATVRTFCLLTTTPSATIAAVHDRMPVLLDAEARACWLDPAAPAQALQSLLRPAPEDALVAWPVSGLVNSPRNDDARCIEPLAPRQGWLL